MITEAPRYEHVDSYYDRTWVTREDIAQLHEVIAERAVSRPGKGEAFVESLDHAARHYEAADNLRWIEWYRRRQ